jgi:enoyl-CoA hydratase
MEIKKSAREDMMGYKFIELELADNIAVVSLARVQSLNALSHEFAKEIANVFRELGKMDEVRAIILNSRARIFCAGLDLREAAGSFDGKAGTAIKTPETARPLFDCCDEIEACPKPVIAAVNGKCIGGGLDMICACDIRLCTEDAAFCLKEAAIGFVADMGVLQRLPHIIGQGFTREMAYTAEEYPAKDAERMGLVNAVYSDMESMMAAARKLALRIASNAPLGVRCTKEVLNYSRFANIQDGMSLAIHKNMVLMGSEDLKEAMYAFLEKRAPKFKGN